MFNNQNNPSEYFASAKPEECASSLLSKARSFYTMLTANSYLEKIAKMWRAYNGAYQSDIGYGHQISFTGEQGELVHLPVNHFRNIAQHIYVMITSNRPTMQARAINTDYKSLAQTYLADGILDYYMREKNLEQCIKDATEMAIVLGSSYVKLEWNATAGDEYDIDPDTNEIIYSGEIEFSVLSPFDVVFDGTRETWDNDWLLTRSFQNRYNLIAKYPEHADKIRGMEPKGSSQIYRLSIWSNDETDDIPVYEFYHRRSEAVPDGRYMLFLDADCVLLDGKMPYRVMPIFRIVPSQIMGTPYGYSPMFDIFPIQEIINSTYSTIATNQTAFGVQNIWAQRGSDLSIAEISSGMNFIESNSKPEALNLTQTPAELFKFLDMMVQAAETISGVSSTTRGDPAASLKSGTALALVQSMSLQFMSGLQQSYVKLIEDVGTAVIQILKDFAKTPKTVALVGKNNRPLLKEFTGDNINAINRVVVDVGNPLSKCLAKDTLVLMYDGTNKKVQDIIIGDQIMGPDSYPRTVGNINQGQEEMYEITSKDKNRNIKYGCNESHILTLKYCSDDYRYDVKKGDILDISVKDYLKLTSREKRLLQGFTVGVEYNKKDLEIPPYILGSWLGDGNSKNTAITTMDQEMVDEWTNYSNLIGMKIRVEENKQPNKSKVYHITSGIVHGKSDRNPFMNSLNQMELINNKHIPFCYLTSNRQDRLELLAGLIDTDGTRIDETYIFTQKNERLSQEVVQLAKSLGFRVTCKKLKVNTNFLKSDVYSEIFKISIGGNTSEIPCKLPRKQCSSKEKSRDPLNYGINVESKGYGNYYGFTLVEEPHFLLGDFTVTHNTVAGRVQMAEQLAQMKLIKTPEQYFQVMNTGSIASIYQGEMSELLLVVSENERLMEGSEVQAVALDQHQLHIQEHKSVLADPDLRTDPVLVKAVMDHIQDHINYLRTVDPDLLQLLGQQPLNPQGPPQSNPNMPPGPQNPPPAPAMVQQGGLPNQGPAGNPAAIMQSKQGLVNPGEEISGKELHNVKTPGLPHPPAPFQHNPVLPGQQVGK